MIKASESLIGEINTKGTITGVVNNGVEKVYPQLENLTIDPSKEKQVFKHENSYGYDEVVVNPITTTEPILQTKTAYPNINQQTITYDEGYEGLEEVKIMPVTASIDNNIVAENIKKGVSILDVEGTLEVGAAEPKLQTKTITPTTNSQTINPDEGYDGFSNVSVNAVTSSIDSNIQAGNIKEGVSILGVTGNLKTGGGDTPSEVKGIVITESDEQGYALSVSTKGITNIPEYFFGNSNGLTQKLQTITLPDEVVSFSNNAFRGNTSIVNVNIPQGMSKLAGHCFRGCTKLQMSVIPANITVLENNIFQECQAITSMRIEGDITSFGNGVFYRITNFSELILPNVTSVVPLGGTSVFTNTKIASGTGYIYVPDHLVDGYKASWTSFANQIKGISEL